MKIGFTGTREGMSEYQRRQFCVELLKRLEEEPESELHHGGCRGADREAHAFAALFACPNIVHPGSDTILPDQVQITSSLIMPAKPNLVRNHDIVDTCEVLIAAPFTDEEQLRSGTWATIRYARKQGKEVVILRRVQ